MGLADLSALPWVFDVLAIGLLLRVLAFCLCVSRLVREPIHNFQSVLQEEEFSRALSEDTRLTIVPVMSSRSGDGCAAASIHTSIY